MNAIARTWDQLKADCVGRRMLFAANADLYTVFWEDGELRGETQIWRTTLPDTVALSVDQAANDVALADFEANYKTTCNTPATPPPCTQDGREMVRLTVTNRTTSYSHRAIYFKTASLGSVHNVHPVTGADWGDATLKLFDADGDETTVAADAVRTQVDWEAAYNYEIIGGGIDFDPTLAGGTTDAWFVSAIGAPDYTPEQYGSIPFVSDVNVEMVKDCNVQIDGRSSQFMAYQMGGAPHTNRLRFTFKHPVGEQRRFQIHIDHYI